jgi:hypothetical protein
VLLQKSKWALKPQNHREMKGLEGSNPPSPPTSPSLFAVFPPRAQTRFSQPFQISRQGGQLADLIGASRAKVGQVLADLQRRKIVIREGRQFAVVMRSLEALVRSATSNGA